MSAKREKYKEVLPQMENQMNTDGKNPGLAFLSVFIGPHLWQ